MKKILAVVISLSPSFALAQTTAITDTNSLVNRLVGIGNVIIYLLVSLAVIFIVYNIVMYIVKGADPKEKSAHLANIGWGILGLAIIVSIWGLVGILTRSFNTVPTNNPLPNLGNQTGAGGIPGNQIPQIP